MKVVIGLGITGLSCIDYFVRQGQRVIAMDTAEHPAGYEKLKAKHPQIPCFLGSLNPERLQQADEIILSPGVPPEQPLLAECKKRGIPLVGDIELLARSTDKPIYAITGSNGKSTVTTWIGEMAKAAGRNMAVAGNIGTPVLDIQQSDGYILELSSFQLETTDSLQAKSAVLLNLSPDHLDRHKTCEAYLAAKQRIYQNCENPLVNLDAPEVWQSLSLKNTRSFSLYQKADYCIDQSFLTSHGERLLSVNDLCLQGEHNWSNALVALAMGEVMGLPRETLLTVLRQFSGLPHRCQWVRNINGVTWYNDSKGTNTGATETAINSIAKITPERLILLAGGQGKGTDFSELQSCVKRHVSDVILFGQDAALMEQALKKIAHVIRVDSLQAAVELAHQRAKSGDSVLLSPACASFDMFVGYEDRGKQFMNLVNALSLY